MITTNKKSYSTSKMTSADITNNNKFKNKKLNNEIIKLLPKNTNTINDLLTYSIQDLNLILNKNIINNLITLIHSNNLKFIDELSENERKEIIQKSNIYQIMNSSISWINMSNTSHRNFTAMNINNLEKLIAAINNTWFYFLESSPQSPIHENTIYELLNQQLNYNNIPKSQYTRSRSKK